MLRRYLKWSLLGLVLEQTYVSLTLNNLDYRRWQISHQLESLDEEREEVADHKIIFSSLGPDIVKKYEEHLAHLDYGPVVYYSSTTINRAEATRILDEMDANMDKLRALSPYHQFVRLYKE